MWVILVEENAIITKGREVEIVVGTGGCHASDEQDEMPQVAQKVTNHDA